MYKQSKLNNGLTIITSENNHSRLVNISFVVKVGARYESQEERGITHFLEHIILRGTKNHSSFFEFNRIIDRSGVQIGALTGVESVKLSAVIPKDQANVIIDLMVDMIINPLLDPQTIENEKGIVEQELHRLMDNKELRIWLETMKSVFAGHPLSNHSLESLESIKSITQEKLINYHQRFFTPNRVAVICVGNIDHDELVNFLNKKTEGWTAKEEINLNNDFTSAEKNREKFVKASGAQTAISVDFPVFNPSPKEISAFDFIANFLGYRSTSLLYQELKRKMGLAYALSVINYLYSDASMLVVSTFTTKPKLVLEIIRDKIFRMEEFIDEKLFKEYQDQMININNRQVGEVMNELQFLCVHWLVHNRLFTPAEYQEGIKNLTLQEVIDMKRKYLTNDNMFVVALGEENPFFTLI